ncbi:GLUG motif-containing protein, partial [Stenotrophomonas maltophilia]
LNAKATIRASGSQGKVETYRPGLNVGGLVGYNMFGHVSDSSASGQVEAGGAGYTGGLVGLSSGGEIFRSQASGSVYSKGGLAT